MHRVAISLGTLIAMMAIAPAAEAGSYSFSVGGHRFHVEAPRNCRSASCVSISSNRSLRQVEDTGTRPTSSLAPLVQVPPPAPSAPSLAATMSQPIVPPPAPRAETSRPEAVPANCPRVELPRVDLPTTAPIDPPRLEPPLVPRAEIKPAASVAQRNQDEGDASTPLGEWESIGAKGMVRIERCGLALCGYALTEDSNRGESVLVNMKPKSHDVWTGSIYSRSSGNTYYATMTLRSSGRLHVEACAFGRFWCSGKDWTRVEVLREQMITTSRPWSARS
jgi:uncharacterized protein (DUF2147 family)